MSADLSDELASLALAAPVDGAHSPSSSASPSSTSPIQGHPSAPMMHTQPMLEGEIAFEAEIAAKSAAAANGEHQRRASGFAGRANNKLEINDRRTVFIPNLPRDATLREVQNMFAFADGFIKVQLYDQKMEGCEPASAGTASGTSTPPNEKVPAAANGNGNGTNGNGRADRENLTYYGAFILFETAAQALQARDRLHNMVFDSSQATPVVLQARLALKNLFVAPQDAVQAQSQKSSRRGSQGGFANGVQVIPPSENPQAAHLNGHGYSPATAAVMVNNMIQSFSPLLSPQHAGSYNIHSGYHSPALSPVPIAYGMAPPALQNGLNGYYTTDGLSPHAQHQHHAMHQQQGVFAGMYQQAHGGYHRQHNHHTSHAGPYNPPCTTLFLARLDQLSNEELYSLLVNSFGETLTGSKFMVDSKGQRIAFVEFDCIETATVALQRISNYMGLSAAFSKNPLNVRVK